MIDSEIYGYIVEYKGKLWKTPKGKFFWDASGPAKNAVHYHSVWDWTNEGHGKAYYTYQREAQKDYEKNYKVLRVKLTAVEI